jgi:hypothetical protein
VTVWGVQESPVVAATTWMPIHQQLFLLAHDSDGTLRASADTIRFALAGAVFVELALTENLRIESDRILVYSSAPRHPDPLAAATITALLRVDGPKPFTHWLRLLAADAYDRVSGGLLAAGVVRRETRRKDARYVHTDTTTAQRCLSVVRESVYSRNPPTPATLTLCGFIALLRLHSQLHLNINGPELVAHLNALFALSDIRIQHIVHITGQLIQDTGMRPYH